MALIGDLEIRLRADIARLQRDMDQARQSVNGAMGHIGRAAGVAAAALAAVGVGLSVAAFSGFIRGAIDAADAASKLSAKIGVQVKDVAGLELAYKLSGLSAESLTTTMARLSTGIADGNKGLTALSIQTRNADGTFKSTKDTLYSVADAFKGLDDGSQKTALAVQLFGKAGADMIPLLNGGSQGLREMDEMAAKLGLTISEKTAKDAEAFNDTLDLVKLGGQGVANGIAAQLLPTLNNLAGSFLESMTSGDKLKKTADFLAASMKILYTVGVGIVTAFSAVGKTLGAAGAQIVAFFSGDFKIAAQIGRDWAADMNTDFRDSAKQISDAWSTTGNETVATLAALSKKTKVIVEEDSKLKKAASDAAKLALKEEADAYKLVLKLAQERANLRNKEYDDINAYMQSQQEGYNAAVKGSRDALAAAQAEYDQFGMSKSQIAEITLLTLESTKAKYLDGSAGAIAAQQQIDAQRKLIAVMRGTEALEAEKKFNTDRLAEQKKTVEKYDDIFRIGFADMVNGGKNTWKSFTKSLATTFKTSVADQMYKMFAQPFVVKFVASMMGIVGGGASGAVQAATGGSGALGMASNAYSMYNSAAFAGNALFGSGSGTVASWLAGTSAVAPTTVAAANIAGAVGGDAIGTLTAGYSGAAGTAATGTAAGGFSTVLAAIPVWGWAAMAAIAVASIFGGRGEKKITGQGIEGNFGAGGFSGNNFSAWEQDGGWFHSDRDGKTPSPLDEATAKQFSDSYASIKSTASGMAATLGFSADSIADYSKKISVTLTTDMAKNQEAIATMFGAVGEDMAKSLLTGISMATDVVDAEYYLASNPDVARNRKDRANPQRHYDRYGKNEGRRANAEDVIGVNYSYVVRENETYSAALQRLSVSLSAVNGMFDTLNLKLYDTSIAGGDMASKLADLFGGLENMAAVSAGYFQSYYSEQEKVDIATRQLGKTFSDLGFVMPAATEAGKAELRRQIEAQQAMGASGQKSYAQLMGLSGAFASLSSATDQLESAAGVAADTVRSTADILSERLGLQDQLDQLTMTSAQLLAKQRDALDESNRALFDNIQATRVSSAAADALASANGGIQQQIDALIKASLPLAAQRAMETAGMAESTLALQNRLYALQDEAAAITAAAAAQKELADSLKASTTDALAALSKSVDAEKARIGVIRDVAAESVRAVTGIFDLLKDQVSQLYGAVGSTSAMQATQGNAFIDAALRAVQSSGYLPDQQQLASAIAGARGGLDASQFATQFEADRATLVMAGKLSQLQGASGYQLTAAEQSLKIANDQLSALDSQLEYAQRQVDALNGINVSVLSVGAAMSGLASAMLAQSPTAGSPYMPATPAGGTSGGGTAGSGGGNPSPYTGGITDSVAGLTAAQLKYYDSIVGMPGQGTADELLSYVSQLQDVQALASFENIKGIFDSQESGDSIMARYGYSLLDALSGDPKKRYSQLPAFDGGINRVPFDMTARIHADEAVVPAVFNPFNPNARVAMASGSGNTDRLERLVEGLTTQVILLKTELAAIKGHTERTANATNGNPDRPVPIDVTENSIGLATA